MNIGFIGLGHLGTPIAENLLEHHTGMMVYNRTISKAKLLEEKGAVVCESVKQLASACDIIFTIVSNDDALKQITDWEDGIAANLKPGGIHISMSTVLPVTSNELFKLHQQYENHYIACPVSGRPDAARNKQLNFIVSGSNEIINTIKPLLTNAGAAAIWEFGAEPGASNVAKLCTNYLILGAIQSISEGINLARKSGIDEAAWMNMMTATLFNCGIYKSYGDIILKDTFHPVAFTLELGLKDATLINQQAETAGASMPLAALIKNEFEELLKGGFGDFDWSALALSVK
ncbi:NAD(P)-dependent oxidoreductase [Parafilimonas terrae]|jgi:3-hydroxyisobutyrate dehydrogenase-like beta-hydroxyacid dehydrogenase|uniref:3-hydroxyisobutyrate dehydrogenase n=1 Tax=Parafilimonas terrae TaxID=1465490 RepID=A0A1I5YUG6_9BACT|nr:NAD(P)-dependent oxidoreductase [Parafilimonas terrae]SFQ47856.1 3-hydroxyisobutyrate dehydrogenase [Parafilimonas terrae]